MDVAAAAGGAEADPTAAGAVKGKAASTFSGATVNSIMMTIATELGDKTFCIAAVMAMRYNRLFVFAGGIGALLVMTVLSVGIGVAVPTLLPKVYTHYAAAALFAYFGVKLLKEAREMTIAGTGGSNEELAEAEEELGFSAKEEKGSSGGGAAAATAPTGGAATSGGLASVDIEAGVSSAAASGSSGGGVTARPRKGDASAEPPSPGGLPTPTGGAIVPLATGGASASSSSSLGAASPSGAGGASSSSSSAGSAAAAGAMGSLMTLLSVSLAKDWAILTQAFSITFLAEWGDRSQIATIAMAAAQNAYGGA